MRSFFTETLHNWGFKHASLDQQILFLYDNYNIIILIIAVDHMIFKSDSSRLIFNFKNKLGQPFHVKLFDEANQIIGQEAREESNIILISQAKYVKKLLQKYDVGK